MLNVTLPYRMAPWMAIVGSLLSVFLGSCGGSSAGANSTPAPIGLAAPADLTASPGNTTVQLSWSPVTGATGYVVDRDGASVGSPVAGNFVDSELTNGTTYTYTVKATNGSASSASSAKVSATPQAPLSAPGAPSGLTATAGDASVVLAWTATAGASSYKVFRNGAAVGSPTTNSYTDSGLTNGTMYMYTISAVNSVGASPESAAASATPTAAVSVPAVPTGLTATVGNATVALTWSTVTGATGYRVYRNGNSIGSCTTNSYTDTGLTNGVGYTYTVAAANSAGTGPPSASVSATPDPQVPTTPTGVSATTASGSVALSWNAVSGATTYKVTRNGTLIASPAATNFVDAGLANGTTYTYTVAAANAGGASAPSVPVSATPTGGQSLGTPTGLTGVPGQGTSILTWSPVAGATHYSVYRSSSASGLGTLVGTPSLNMFTDMGVSSNYYSSTPVSYYYVVGAVNGAGAGSNSAQVMVTPNYLVPAAPENFVATAGDTLVSLAWTTRSLDITPATSFLIYRNNVLIGSPTVADHCTSSVIATGTVYSCRYTDTGLTNGTPYTYSVAGVSKLGQSPFTALRNTVPLAPPTAPYAPTGLTAVPGNAIVSLNWNTLPAGAVNKYKVYRNGTQVGSVTASASAPAPNYGYTDTGLANGTSYSYTVSAVNATGEGPVSLQVQATPSGAVPPAPTGVTAIAGNTFVTLNWNAVNTATGYNVYRNGALIGQTLLGSLTDVGLNNGTSYSYYVTATNAIGEGSQSPVAAATPLSTIIPAVGTYAQPYTVGFLDNPATLTVYAPAQGNGAGAVPPGCTGWTSYGLRCDQTNIVWDHVWIQGSVYWTGTGSLIVTNSIIEGLFGNAPIEAHATAVQPNAVITVTDSTLRWMPGQAEPIQLGTGQVWSTSGLQSLVLLRNDLSGMSQGPNPQKNCLFDSNYLHYFFQNLQVQGGVLQDAHIDGMFNEGADNTLYQRNYLDAPVRTDVSAALFFQAQGLPPTSTGNKIYANFINGGGSLIGNQTGLSVDVINNTMGAYVYAVDVYTSSQGTFGTWTGNVTTDGTPVPVP